MILDTWEHFDFKLVTLQESYVNVKPLQEFVTMCKKAFPNSHCADQLVPKLSNLYLLPLPHPFLKIASMHRSILTEGSYGSKPTYDYVATSIEVELLPPVYRFVVSPKGTHIIFRHDDFYIDGAHVIFRPGKAGLAGV